MSSREEEKPNFQDKPNPHTVTRREFVKQAALTAGSLPALSDHSLGLFLFSKEPFADKVSARVDHDKLILENETISAEWQLPSGGLQLMDVHAQHGGKLLRAPSPAFQLTLADNAVIDSTALRIVGAPRIERLQPTPGAARYADRLAGKQIVAIFRYAEGKLEVQWRTTLREGSHYIRQELTLKASKADLPLHAVMAINIEAPSAHVLGSVDGSPIVADTWFLACEHPLSQSNVANGRAQCRLVRQLALKAGQSITYSSVIGTTAPGQLRRDFLRYIERERAHPYRTFLHYNSWYDLGYFTPFDEAAAVNAINAFGQELQVKRGVTLDSFLFDDGWDDHKLWGFNSGFPRGFAPLQEAAAKYGAAPGVWLSPWGGYSKPKQERLAYGKEHGFEMNEDGLALSGPVYYRRFREVCIEMIRKYGVNQFKFDGTGNATRVIPGSEFGSDFEAALRLIADLRVEKPDLYVNLTTGTYPSPFWLMHADSTWRGGEDHDFAGVGPSRQQWITYRDADTFANVVKRGPLYPINSLMLHGLIFARHAKNLGADPHDDFPDEVRSYFATGTQLQEMYITPALLSEENWDTLAEAANWSRRNSSVLIDTHWIGGDPGALEVYGWASWSPGKGIVTLRSPKDGPQSFDLDVGAALELPAPASGRFSARQVWKSGSNAEGFELQAGEARTIRLQPFEVLTLELTPRKGQNA
ncbi:MAG TPA: enterotoxin [Candidatus Angelobacter sp.]|nr:enterotoxin [Candidatus Angelobacter sp.]